jgi:hypothetical protein
VAPTLEPEEILQVMPADAPQKRMLRDQASHNDAKRRVHKPAQISAAFRNRSLSGGFVWKELE